MTEHKIKIDKHIFEEDRFLFSALLGISVIAVVQLVSAPQLDTSLTISTHCFAVSIPLMVLHILARRSETQHQYAPDSGVYIYILTFLGPVICFTGLGALFWHFSWTAGSSFIVVGLCSFIAWLAYDEVLQKANKD